MIDQDFFLSIYLFFFYPIIFFYENHLSYNHMNTVIPSTRGDNSQLEIILFI